jgi:hypothetical protein
MLRVFKYKDTGQCLMTGLMIIERVKCVYDEMKISDMCTFSEGCVQNFKEPQLKDILRWNTSLIGCTTQV